MLVGSGCTDLSLSNRPAESPMHRPIPANAPGFGRVARPGELPAELVSQAEAAVRTAQAGGAGPTVSKPAVDVAVGSLSPGVIAMVARQGGHVTLAFSEHALTDGLFVAVDRLLSDDLAERPDIAGTRTLAVMADHSVRATEGGSEQVLPYRLRALEQGEGAPITARIREGIRNQVPTLRAGMGTVRIARGDPDGP